MKLPLDSSVHIMCGSLLALDVFQRSNNAPAALVLLAVHRSSPECTCRGCSVRKGVVS